MTELAIDRFRDKRLPRRLEDEARDRAAIIGSGNADFLLGYLQASVAMALERPRWASKDKLALDLRTVQLLREGGRR